jgi:hypothetical protein
MTSSQKTFVVGCIVGLLGAGGALLFARYQQRVLAYYGTEPQRITVAELTEGGFQGKHWVELAGLRLGPRAVVGAERGKIDAIWIPVFPAGAADYNSIHVVLRSTKSRSLEEFALRLRDRTSFRGSLVDPSPAGASCRELLAASYPSATIAPEICEIDIDFGGPAYSSWATPLHSASGGLLVFGVICLLGFIGSCFKRKDDLIAPGYESLLRM